jgi:hypothetical protein
MHAQDLQLALTPLVRTTLVGTPAARQTLRDGDKLSRRLKPLEDGGHGLTEITGWNDFRHPGHRS